MNTLTLVRIWETGWVAVEHVNESQDVQGLYSLDDESVEEIPPERVNWDPIGGIQENFHPEHNGGVPAAIERVTKRAREAGIPVGETKGGRKP